jgi:predicted permease
MASLRRRRSRGTSSAPALNILAITVPIYVVMAIGFLAGRADVFSPLDMRVLGKFVVKFALPALLFTALSQRPLADILNGGYVAAYAGGALIMFGGVAAFARFVRRKSVSHSVLIALGSSFSNSGFVGYPIALQILGPPAAVALAMCMIVENVLVFPLALVLAEMGNDQQQRWQKVLAQSLGGMVRNPMIIAIFAGFVVALFGIQLSEPLVRTINMLAMASTALALFVIGGSLVGLDVQNVLGAVAGVALAKLLLHPLAVFAMLWLLPPIDPPLRMAAVIYASMPMLSIYPILAQRYHYEGFCAAALLVATLLSFVTVSIVLWLMTSVLGWSP